MKVWVIITLEHSRLPLIKGAAQRMASSSPPTGLAAWKNEKCFAVYLRERNAACEFVEPNPKRLRGNNPKAIARYDGYMSARTFGEFFDRGYGYGDLLYDFGRG